jgi:uncharacterized protein (DUF2126 family)
LICNDIIVPLQLIDLEKNEYLANIRFKSIAPHKTAHPTILIQTPLRFWVLDKELNKPLFGFCFDPNADLIFKREKSNMSSNINNDDGLTESKKKKLTLEKNELFTGIIQQAKIFHEFPFILDLRLNSI